MKAGDILTLPCGITVTYVRQLKSERHLTERKHKDGIDRIIIGPDETGTLDILGYLTR